MGMFDDLPDAPRAPGRRGLFDDLPDATEGAGKFAAPALANASPQPYQNMGEAAGGLVRSAGVGLLQGAMGLGTLPGNVEGLARAGINAGAGLLGVEPPVDPDTALINYNDLKGRVEGRFGPLYKPQTTAEEYVRTIGEFAPMAIGGGAGLAQKAGQVLAPAIASETAGQATEGTSYEPYARVAGALAGGAAANLGARTITPAPADPVRAGQVAELQRAGVTDLLAGQRTGNERLRWIEDAATKFPGGGRMRSAQTNQAEQFSGAALREAGVPGNRAIKPVLDKAFEDIGQQYNTVGQVASVVADRSFPNRLQNVVARYRSLTPEAQRVPMIEETAAEVARLSRQPGGMTGQQYLGYRSDLRRAQRGMRDNPHASEALGRLVETIDVQMIRSAPRNIRPQVAAYMNDLNRRYHNLKIIEHAADGAGEGVAAGLITPARLRQSVTAVGGRGTYARGRNKLAELAKAGEGVIKPLPSSGTAERNLAQQIVQAPGAGYSAAAGALATGSIEGALLGSAAPWVINALTARTISNPTVRGYLSNQLMPGRVEVGPRAGVGMSPFLLQRDDLGEPENALTRLERR